MSEAEQWLTGHGFKCFRGDLWHRGMLCVTVYDDACNARLYGSQAIAATPRDAISQLMLEKIKELGVLLECLSLTDDESALLRDILPRFETHGVHCCWLCGG